MDLNSRSNAEQTPNIRHDEQRRIVRIPMSLVLIREMDTALVARAGGYTTREEFIGDAVRDRLLELEFEPAPPGPGETTALPPHDGHRPSLSAVRPQPEEPTGAPGFDLEETILHAPAAGFALEGEATVHDATLLGLHNRDYTSLWALRQLADVLASSPLPIAPTLSQVTERAWEFSSRLKPLDAGAELKLTSLFPTNRSKVQSASGQFRAFAVGTVREADGRLHGDGPLFVWRTVQARRVDEGIEIGLTGPGWDLLSAVEGISLRLPHQPELTTRFFNYLRRHAPADLAGLTLSIRGAGERMTRAELISTYQSEYPAWTEAQSSTNAAGYVARGREWGLIEPKLIERRYRLTPQGEKWVDRLANEGG
jgi:hypothetical protein